jgi:hypothetical protein
MEKYVLLFVISKRIDYFAKGKRNPGRVKCIAPEFPAYKRSGYRSL